MRSQLNLGRERCSFKMSKSGLKLILCIKERKYLNVPIQYVVNYITSTKFCEAYQQTEQRRKNFWNFFLGSMVSRATAG